MIHICYQKSHVAVLMSSHKWTGILRYLKEKSKLFTLKYMYIYFHFILIYSYKEDLFLSFLVVFNPYFLLIKWIFRIKNHCKVKNADKTTNITKSRKITIMNCLEIITILFSFFSCLHFDFFLGKIYIASNLPCC